MICCQCGESIKNEDDEFVVSEALLEAAVAATMGRQGAAQQVLDLLGREYSNLVSEVGRARQMVHTRPADYWVGRL